MKKIKIRAKARQIQSALFVFSVVVCAALSGQAYGAGSGAVTINVDVAFEEGSTLSNLTGKGVLTIHPGPPVKGEIRYVWERNGNTVKFTQPVVDVAQLESLLEVAQPRNGFETQHTTRRGEIALPVNIDRDRHFRVHLNIEGKITDFSVPVLEAKYQQDEIASAETHHHIVRSTEIDRYAPLESLTRRKARHAGDRLLFFREGLASEPVPALYMGSDLFGQSIIVLTNDLAEVKSGARVGLAFYAVDRRTLGKASDEVYDRVVAQDHADRVKGLDYRKRWAPWGSGFLKDTFGAAITPNPSAILAPQIQVETLIGQRTFGAKGGDCYEVYSRLLPRGFSAQLN